MKWLFNHFQNQSVHSSQCILVLWMKLWIMSHKLSTGVSAWLRADSSSCSSLRWTAGYGGMAEEIKGCYWCEAHTLLLWCPWTHSCKVIRQKQAWLELCSQFSVLSPSWSLTYNIFIYTEQKASIDFPIMHSENIVPLEGCRLLCDHLNYLGYTHYVHILWNLFYNKLM